MMKIKRKEAFFSISAVAKMFSVHQQTIRLYEKQGLLTPKRSEGNTRLFTEEDIDRLEEIIHLTHELGINLAGVEMILKLKKQIKKMQKEINKLFENTQKDLDVQQKQAQETTQKSFNHLLEIKNKTKSKRFLLPSQEKNEPTAPQEEEWKIEYEE